MMMVIWVADNNEQCDGLNEKNEAVVSGNLLG